jgi:hypothetical protein
MRFPSENVITIGIKRISSLNLNDSCDLPHVIYSFTIIYSLSYIFQVAYPKCDIKHVPSILELNKALRSARGLES